MINLNRKLLFIDITKTAGTSIINYFQETFPKEEWVGKHHSVPNFTPRISIIDVKEKHLQKEWKVFTVVRNPWDRLLSTYFWGIHGDYKGYSFKEFVHAVNKNTFHEYNSHRYRTQYSWLSDKEGNVRVPHINILKFENLHQEFKMLCQKWDLGEGELPHINTANERLEKAPHTPNVRGHYSDWYADSELRDIVGDMYQKDIYYFNYKFTSY